LRTLRASIVEGRWTVDYATIKALKVAGQSPELSQLDAAIKSQETILGAAAVKLATLAGEHAAAHDMPFALECEEAYVKLSEAQDTLDHEGARLAKLVRWRTLKAQGLR
jgi:hypothetical protein